MTPQRQINIPRLVNNNWIVVTQTTPPEHEGQLLDPTTRQFDSPPPSAGGPPEYMLPIGWHAQVRRMDWNRLRPVRTRMSEEILGNVRRELFPEKSPTVKEHLKNLQEIIFDEGKVKNKIDEGTYIDIMNLMKKINDEL